VFLFKSLLFYCVRMIRFLLFTEKAISSLVFQFLTKNLGYKFCLQKLTGQAVIKVFYSPTNAQVTVLKTVLKFILK